MLQGVVEALHQLAHEGAHYHVRGDALVDTWIVRDT
jgi:hypothetical protein